MAWWDFLSIVVKSFLFRTHRSMVRRKSQGYSVDLALNLLVKLSKSSFGPIVEKLENAKKRLCRKLDGMFLP